MESYEKLFESYEVRTEPEEIEESEPIYEEDFEDLEQLEMGERIIHNVQGKEVEVTIGKETPIELLNEMLEITDGKEKYLLKAVVIGREQLIKTYGFDYDNISEKILNGRLEVELRVGFEEYKEFDYGTDIEYLFIPDFVTKVKIENQAYQTIKKMYIGKNLRKMDYMGQLIIENIKISSENKYLRAENNESEGTTVLYDSKSREIYSTNWEWSYDIVG